jgi:hypothetical protein
MDTYLKDILYTLSFSEFFQYLIILFLFVSSIIFWVRYTNQRYVMDSVDLVNTPLYTTYKSLNGTEKRVALFQDITKYSDSFVRLYVPLDDTPGSTNYTLYI